MAKSKRKVLVKRIPVPPAPMKLSVDSGLISRILVKGLSDHFKPLVVDAKEEALKSGWRGSVALITDATINCSAGSDVTIAGGHITVAVEFITQAPDVPSPQ